MVESNPQKSKSNSKRRNLKTNTEQAKDMSAEDLAWDIFKKTGDINYYRFYSAIKKEIEDK